MVADEVGARRRNQRGEAAQEFGGLQQQCLAGGSPAQVSDVGLSGELAKGPFLLGREDIPLSAKMTHP